MENRISNKAVRVGRPRGPLVPQDAAGEREQPVAVGRASDLHVLGLHHLGQRLLDPQRGEPGGRVVGPALGHELQHGAQALGEQSA